MPPAPPIAWQDGPLTSGDWSLNQQGALSEAVFTSAGGALLAIRCQPGGQIAFARPGAAPGVLTVATSFGERTLPGSGNDGSMAMLGAADPLFDELAFSRGRFRVRVPGREDLVLPTWPEPARVIEECRGQ